MDVTHQQLPLLNLLEEWRDVRVCMTFGLGITHDHERMASMAVARVYDAIGGA